MKKMYLIGKSLKHSISPIIHNKIFSYYNIEAIYENVELPTEEDLKRFTEDIKKDQSAIGFNVTIPYKESILKFCDHILDDVKIIRAANTIKNENGKLIAYNTDWMGFVRSLYETGVDVRGKRILVLGAGGAAKACIFGLYKMGVSEIYVANRTLEKAFYLKEQFKDYVNINVIEWKQKSKLKFSVIINTTSIGMFPKCDEAPFEYEGLSTILENGESLVYDLIYNPIKTKLLKMAEEKNIVINNGLKMLIYQAVEADLIWGVIYNSPPAHLVKEIINLSEMTIKDLEKKVQDN